MAANYSNPARPAWRAAGTSSDVAAAGREADDAAGRRAQTLESGCRGRGASECTWIQRQIQNTTHWGNGRAPNSIRIKNHYGDRISMNDTVDRSGRTHAERSRNVDRSGRKHRAWVTTDGRVLTTRLVAQSAGLTVGHTAMGSGFSEGKRFNGTRHEKHHLTAKQRDRRQQ